jgi:hypothetical protein
MGDDQTDTLPASPDALAKLDETLRQIREDEVAERREEQERHDDILMRWRRVEPLLRQAIQQVNEVLVRHGYGDGMTMAPPEFRDPKRRVYGAQFSLRAVSPFAHLTVYVADDSDALHMDGGWGGPTIPMSTLTVETIANALAETVQWIAIDPP